MGEIELEVEDYLGEGLKLSQFWRKQLAAEKNVIIASPYLTAPLADEVIRSCDQRTVCVLTRCDLKDFVRGASSIKVLRRLIEAGIQVLDLPHLHAKVICANSWVSIGSQNLTKRSEKNLEASLVMHSATQVSRVRSVLDQWRSEAEPITMEDIDAIAVNCEILRAEWRQLRGKLQRARGQILALRHERRERQLQEEWLQSLREEEEERDRLETEAQIAAAELRIDRDGRASERRRIYVLDIVTNGRTQRVVRRTDHATSLLNWKDNEIRLHDKHHYVVFAHGRIAWLKINETQCSLFGTGFTRQFPSSHVLAGYKLVVDSFSPAWPVNIRGCLLDPHAAEVRVWEGWLDDSGFAPTRDTHSHRNDGYLLDLLGRDTHSWFEGEVIRPFRYDKNNHGSTILDVFNAERGKPELQIFPRGDSHILARSSTSNRPAKSPVIS